MLTIKQALEEAGQLQAVSESWQLDAELLLADALQSSREHLFTWPLQELQQQPLNVFRSHCQRRLQGEPIAYILGSRAFWDFELQVNHHVLIPRPETELLVESAIALLRSDQFQVRQFQDRESQDHQSPALQILDLGTGSGAIALALAREDQNWQLTAVDISAEALQLARKNADALKLSNIEFRQASWCDGLPANEYDMIVANPPYIAADDEHLREGDIRFEPLMALVAEENGLADIRQIVRQSRDFLKKDSWLLIEHGYNQQDEVAAILRAAAYSNIECRKDLAGIARMSAGQFLA
ncbi:MAG: peptide chain release factor N(5)-glutamine methyltransferase [Pseudohongiella sp.]|nr:peptide chain release factor N(5)-glutamine methyltransferase [Pseudohongiella sp.]